MNLRYFERRTEVVRAYVRAENGCEETNHFVKPSAVELARIAEARNGRKKFDVFVKPNGQSRACASYAMAKKQLLKTNLFLSILFLLAASAAGAQEPPVTEAEIERQEQQRARETTEQRVEQAVEGELQELLERIPDSLRYQDDQRAYEA